jgi:hypothetical protein
MSKQLPLNRLKTFAFLLAFSCLFSCKKEIIAPSAQTDQLIKQKTIVDLLNKMPASTLLTPEWENATQATIVGKKIVRMPISNVDKLKHLRLGGQDLGLNMQGKRMDIKESTNNSNPNYFEKHPPELFIVEDAGTHKLDAYIFNFVPTNPNVEFGEKGVWTGTLYEWNLAGENVWVQEIVKNKLVDRYGLRKPVEQKTTATQASGKILGQDNKKISSIFDVLADVIGDVVGWIAHTVGIPSEFRYDNMNSGWRIKWGSNAKVDAPDPMSLQPPSSMEISASYISGYFEGNGGYQPFPISPDGSEGSVVVPASTIYLINMLQLTNSLADRQRMNLLSEYPAISDKLALFLQAEGINQEAHDFVMWALDYMNNNPNFNRSADGLVEKLFLVKNLGITQDQTNFIAVNPDVAISLKTMFESDNNFSENKTIAETLIEELTDEVNNTSNTAKSGGLIAMIKGAISTSIIETAKLTRKLYLQVNELAKIYPGVISGINSKVINPIRSSLEVNLNPQTLEWRDLFNIWFFELGTFPVSTELSSPTIKIYQGANVITADGNLLGNALNRMPSVNNLRERLLNSVKNTNVSIGHMISERYNYNVDEYYGSLLEQNTAKIFLGSFDTKVYLSAKSGNSATFLFVVKNVSGWESATRFIKASGSTPTGIIDDKPRGTGLNIGGNFGQDIEWTETITW